MTGLFPGFLTSGDGNAPANYALLRFFVLEKMFLRMLSTTLLQIFLKNISTI